MNRPARWFAGCIALIWTGAAAASELPWTDAAKRPPVLSGDFEQTRTVQGFSRPLVSRGRFVTARGIGLLWETVTPFAGSLRITRDEVEQRQGDTVVQRSATASDPVAQGVADILLSLFDGSADALQRLFEIEVTASGDDWRMALTPRGLAMRQGLAGIHLRGRRHIDEVVLREAGGDSTRIVFSNLAEAERLAERDARAFE